MTRAKTSILAGAAVFLAVAFSMTLSLRSADIDEFKVKGSRAAGSQEVFEFTEKPSIARSGDKITIRFAAKAFCDATVAIEDGGGGVGQPAKIIRHLASGCLGPNAPVPFQKDSLTQSIVWDVKDDRGRYRDDVGKGNLSVRVSLGLKPQFERTFYWSPHKRISNLAPLLAATPEGVYVFQGLGIDRLELFDHAGKYVRTIYPFPADKIGKVVGLQSAKFPQDGPTGEPVPLKIGYEEATLLTSGSSALGTGDHAGGFAATSMAVCNDRVALVFDKLNRIATDGSSGGLPMTGPTVGHRVFVGKREEIVGPTSSAFSPDGKYLYLTGFVWKTEAHMDCANAFHVVKRLEYDKQDPPVVFAGLDKADGGDGDGNDRFRAPLGVDCDGQGRVYVADYANSRIQVFAADGKYLKTIPTPLPAIVKVDRVTGQIWAFSGMAIGPSNAIWRQLNADWGKMKATIRRLGTFDKIEPGPAQALPAIDATAAGGWVTTGGQVYQTAVDSFAADSSPSPRPSPQGEGGSPTLWLSGRKMTVSLAEANWMGGGGMNAVFGNWDNRGIRLLREEEGQWKVAGDFGEMTRKEVVRTMPPAFSRQRLYVNPADEMLYICEEQTGPGKSFFTVLQLNPKTAKIRELKLPFDPEDICFNIDGLIYLRTDHEVVRYDPITWREVPWDYGEERASIGFCGSSGPPRANTVSALPIPGSRPVWWHSSGMWLSAKGHLAVECNIPDKAEKREDKDRYVVPGMGKKFTPTIYPGRSGERIIQIFDEHGRLLHDDAVPGMTNADGIGIDNDDNLYVMVAAPRILDGTPYFDGCSETLAKFRPSKVKFLSAGDAPVALAKEQYPNRPAELTKYGMGRTWVEGAGWFYGGLGYGGQGGSCVCWHSRFQLDYFARSFVPETRHYSVAVLDSAGNLILRIGRYGNVDDGKPMIADGGPAKTQAIGGDEVALSHAAYLGVHTDRRLFIHDAGNSRIVSVKLDYHATEKAPL